MSLAYMIGDGVKKALALAPRTIANLAGRVSGGTPYFGWPTSSSVGGLSWGSEMPLTDASLEDYMRLYQGLVWVYSAVYCVASHGASLHPRVYLQSSKGEVREVVEHPIVDLLWKPNPEQSWYDFCELGLIYMELSGDFYIELVRNAQGVIVQMWPVMSHRMEVIPGDSPADPVAGYVFRGKNNAPTRIEPDRIAHIKYANPLSDFYGQSAITAAEKSILSELYVLNWNNALFKNSARPDYVVEADHPIDDPTYRRMIKQLEQRHGGWDKAHRMALFDAGMKLKALNWKHDDVQFGQLKRLNREEILAAIGVPQVMVGLVESLNFANAREQRRMFFEGKLKPTMAKLASGLSTQLLSLFDDRLFLEFDFAAVQALMTETLEQARTGEILIRSRQHSPNEVRAKLWYDGPYEGGDTIYGMMGMEPVGEAPSPQIGMRGRHVVESIEHELVGVRVSPRLVQQAVLHCRREVIRVPTMQHRVRGAIIEMEAKPVSGLKLIPKAVGDIDVDELLASDNIGDRVWGQHILKHTPLEGEYAAILRKLYRDQLEDVLHRLDQRWPFKTAGAKVAKQEGPGGPGATGGGSLDEEILFDGPTWKAAFVAGLSSTTAKAMKAGAENILLQLDVDPGNFQMFRPEVIEFYTNRTDAVAEMLNDVTEGRLRDELTEALAENASVSAVADRIRDLYSWRDQTAVTAARTEVGIAMSGGGRLAALQTGLNLKHTWVTSRDELVRTPARGSKFDHVAADGETVGMHEQYVRTGEPMWHPLDPGGSAGNIINCRCAEYFTLIQRRGT